VALTSRAADVFLVVLRLRISTATPPMTQGKKGRERWRATPLFGIEREATPIFFKDELVWGN